jgi:urease accessory protein
MKKILCVLGCLLANQVFAHPGHDASFTAAFLHPLTGWDHLLTMLMVGILAYSLPLQKGLALPFIFVAVFATSAMLVSGLHLETHYTNTLNQLILVALIALPLIHLSVVKLSFAWIAGLVALIASVHGATHGVELDVQSGGVIAGLLLSTALIHGLGFASAMGLSQQHAWVLRVFSFVSGILATVMLLQSI